jgi:hypothetical protein
LAITMNNFGQQKLQYPCCLKSIAQDDNPLLLVF